MHRPSRRSRQRGQVIPIVALSTVALLGATALAVDLGLQTHNARTLQNVTDAAALAGAQDLSATPTAADQYQGAQDALLLIHKRMGWPLFPVGGSTTNSAWAAAAAAPCSPAQNTGNNPTCDISVVPPSPNNSYTITIQSPAKTSKTVSHTDRHYFEVTMSQTVKNSFGGAIGEPTSIDATRSTAYHFAPNQPFGFALFAKTVVQTQNKSTLIVGDVYADRYVGPQSSGQAGFCASGGLIVLGSPQATPTGSAYDTKNNPGQADITPTSANVIHTIDACGEGTTPNTTAKGTVNQTREPWGGCTVSGATINATYDSTVGACVANPSLVSSTPKLQQPSLTNPTQSFCGTQGRTGSVFSPGVYSCSNGSSLSLTGSDTLGPGVYEIRHDPNNSHCSPTSCYDLDISTSANLSNVTILLEQNATMGVHGNGTVVTMTPYQPPTPLVPTDGRFSIYAPPGSAAQVWVDQLGANLSLSGTMYLPDGSAITRSNAFFTIDGQAIVGTWDDQGGNHTTADINYNGQRNAPQREVLALVE